MFSLLVYTVGVAFYKTVTSCEMTVSNVDTFTVTLLLCKKFEAEIVFQVFKVFKMVLLSFAHFITSSSSSGFPHCRVRHSG